MQLHDLSRLINEPTCFQSHDPTCIDNTLTNRKTMFKLSKTFESGLWDHHKLVSTIMKSGRFSGPPRKNINRSYKIFDFECFNIALKTKLDCIKGPAYNEFGEELFSVLNIHAPVNIKILRHNNSAFVTKDLSKAIMKRCRLKNLFNKQRTQENWVSYKMQQNHCVNLSRKTQNKLFFYKFKYKRHNWQ